MLSAWRRRIDFTLFKISYEVQHKTQDGTTMLFCLFFLSREKFICCVWLYSEYEKMILIIIIGAPHAALYNWLILLYMHGVTWLCPRDHARIHLNDWRTRYSSAILGNCRANDQPRWTHNGFGVRVLFFPPSQFALYLRNFDKQK